MVSLMLKWTALAGVLTIFLSVLLVDFLAV